MEQYVSLSNIIAIFAVVLLVIYWIHTFTILYHLIRFGVGTRPKQIALLFFLGSFLLFAFLTLAVLYVIFST